MVIEIITAVLAGIGALISAVDALLSHIFSDSKIVMSSCCSNVNLNEESD